MSVNHEQLERLVDKMEQGTAATTKYSWIDLAHEVLRMRRALDAMKDDCLSVARDPERTPVEQNFALCVIDQLDYYVLGENNEC